MASGNTIIGSYNTIDSFSNDTNIIGGTENYIGMFSSGSNIYGGNNNIINSSTTLCSIFCGNDNIINSGLTNAHIIGATGLTASTSFSLSTNIIYAEHIFVTTGSLSSKTVHTNTIKPYSNIAGTASGNITITGNTNLFLGGTVYLGTTPLTDIFLGNWIAPPVNSGFTGTAGQVAYDNNYLYVCYSGNSWGRLLFDTSF